MHAPTHIHTHIAYINKCAQYLLFVLYSKEIYEIMAAFAHKGENLKKKIWANVKFAEA